MSNCVFVVEDWPLTPVAAGGASALIYSHLELMAGAVKNLILVILKTPGYSLGFDDYCQTQPERWAQVQSWCDEIHFVELTAPDFPLPGWMRLVASIFNPALFAYADIFTGTGIREIESLVRSNNPDLIWAEHLIPATIFEQINLPYPLVYSHHDWRWKIKSHRQGKNFNLYSSLKFWLSRRHETRLVKAVTACVSGSAIELDEMYSMGAKKTAYFPTTYNPVDLPENMVMREPLRIVHLGGMQTTANRIGLLRFLQVCWPVLRQSLHPCPELWVIGSLDGATAELLFAMKQENIICTGFVPNLVTVLRPFDIQVIPWEYETGTRTRIPLVLSHYQSLVSTRAAASCLPELENNINCFLVEKLSDMTDVIVSLVQSPKICEQIAANGCETFFKSFTVESQQLRFNDFVQNVMTLIRTL